MHIIPAPKGLAPILGSEAVPWSDGAVRHGVVPPSTAVSLVASSATLFSSATEAMFARQVQL